MHVNPRGIKKIHFIPKCVSVGKNKHLQQNLKLERAFRYRWVQKLGGLACRWHAPPSHCILISSQPNLIPSRPHVDPIRSQCGPTGPILLPESDLLKTSATIVPYAHFWFASMRTGVWPQSGTHFSRLPMHVNPRGINKSSSFGMCTPLTRNPLF